MKSGIMIRLRPFLAGKTAAIYACCENKAAGIDRGAGTGKEGGGAVGDRSVACTSIADKEKEILEAGADQFIRKDQFIAALATAIEERCREEITRSLH